MKKLVAAASAIALTAGLAFAETHETLKAHTLSTSVGDISFGAWGRSTFNVGHQSSSTKITADAPNWALGAAGNLKTTANDYETAKNNDITWATYSAVAAQSGITLTKVKVGDEYKKDDGTTAKYTEQDYVTAVATFAGVKKGYDFTTAGQAAVAVQTALATGNTPTADQMAGAAKFQKLAEEMKAAGYSDADTMNSAKIGEYCTKYAQAMGLVTMLKAQEKDESTSRNYAGLAPDWSYGSRVGFWIVGRTPDQKFGFDLNLDSDARALFVHKLWDADEKPEDTNYNEDGKYAIAIGDQAKIWGLFDNSLFQTKVAFGRMRENELRGTIGDWGQRESSDVKSEDDIFQEIWTATGLFASIKGNEDSPLAGFYMNGAVDIAGTLGTYDKGKSTETKLESAVDKASNKSIPLYEAVRDSQFGVGYTLPGLLQVKAQYWGDSIAASNYRYEYSKYAAARAVGAKNDTEGFGMNDYYGRMEFGLDYLGNMGGATSFLDPNFNPAETPNANLIELGFKLPLVTDNDLRDYDPEKFYNWYSCLGTWGIVKSGFIQYKGHVWGGQGTSNLKQYSFGLVDMAKGDGAKIFMAGIDAAAEVCVNPFGAQNLFVGLSGNYNITSASADGKTKTGLTLKDLELRQHNIAAEIYVKKTFAANNFMFAGIAGNFQLQSMTGNVNDLVDLKYNGKSNRFYMPIGVELFF